MSDHRPDLLPTFTDPAVEAFANAVWPAHYVTDPDAAPKRWTEDEIRQFFAPLKHSMSPDARDAFEDPDRLGKLRIMLLNGNMTGARAFVLYPELVAETAVNKMLDATAINTVALKRLQDQDLRNEIHGLLNMGRRDEAHAEAMGCSVEDVYCTLDTVPLPIVPDTARTHVAKPWQG